MTTVTDECNVFFDIEYFQLPKKLLTGIGQWPYTPKLKRYLYQFVVATTLLNGAPFMIKEFLNRWTTNKNTSTHCIAPLLTQILCFAKFINFNFNDSQMRTLLSYIYMTWKMTIEEGEQNILVSYGAYMKHLSHIYAVCIYAAMVLFLVTPMTPVILDFIVPLNESRSKNLVYPADYGIPLNDFIYYVMFVHSSISTFAALTIVVACDVFFICLVLHACSLFAIVMHSLERLGNDIMDYTVQGFPFFKLNETSGNLEVTRACFKRISYAVAYHNKALKFSALLDSSFTWSLFIILGINMIIISLTGFQILTQKDRWENVLTCLIYMFGQVCHLFLLSLPGQLIVDKSGSVRESINKSYNFDIPAKAQKMLIPIMIRSLRPSKITAGKFFVLQMETFMSVIQTSVSYFTVLANFY